MDSELVKWLLARLPELRFGELDLTLPVWGGVGLATILGVAWFVMQFWANAKTIAAKPGLTADDLERLKRELLEELAPLTGETVDREREATKAIAVERTVEAEPEAAQEIAAGDLKDGFEALKKSARAKANAAAQEWRDIGALAYDRDPGTALEAYREATRLDGSDFWAWIYLARLEQTHGGNVTAAKEAAIKARTMAVSERDQSIAMSELGKIAMLVGDLAAARTAFAESLEIARTLAAANPESAEAQRDVSVSLEKLGDVAVLAGDLVAARSAFTESLEIRRRLAAANPESAEAQRDVSVSLEKLGDVAVQAGDLSAARAAYSESLELARTLAEANPEGAEAQRDVSISLNKLGDVAVKAGDLVAARTAFGESLDIARTLVESNPESAQGLRDVSVSLVKFGDVAVKAGDLVAGRTAFTESLETRRTLAAANPESAEAQRDVIIGLANLAQMTGEVSYWQQALPIVEKLAEEGRLAPKDAWMLEDIRKKAAAQD